MFAQDLYEYYGSWSEMVRELKLGIRSSQYWRKIGYIPYKTQLLIEKRSMGKFKADEAHAKPNQ